MVSLELVELVFQLVDPSVFDDQLAAQQLQLLALGCVCSTELWEQNHQYHKIFQIIISTLILVSNESQIYFVVIQNNH